MSKKDTSAAAKSPKSHAASGQTAQKGERIAKVLARAGVASRREVERMIAAGRVQMAGRVLDTPATLVTGTAEILVDGKPVAERDHTRLWRFNKPGDCVTTSKDDKGRKTVFDALPDTLPRVISVGRLDMTTEGLLLLTNDGELARWMELPKTGWKRTYRVRVYGRVKEEDLAKLKAGLTVDGVRYGAIDASLERAQGANAWLKVSIREGKNREVRKVMEHLGLRVNRLIRISYGPFSLGNLEESTVEEVAANALAASLPEEVRGQFNLPPKSSEPKQGHAKAKAKRAFRGKAKPRGGHR